MGYWLIAQCDIYSPAASAAKVAFEKAFLSSKQPEALAFCKDEILNVSLYLCTSLRLCVEYVSTFITNYKLILPQSVLLVRFLSNLKFCSC